MIDAFIISYFGNNAQLRSERISMHYKQLCSLLQHPNLGNIHILAQDYFAKPQVTLPEYHMVLDHPRIKYHFRDRMTPGQARNELIKVFSETSGKWGMFLDNDAVVDPRYHGMTVLQTLDDNADKIAKFADVISPMSPRHQPFKEWLDDNAELLKTCVPMVKSNYLKTTLFFLKNRKVFGQEPVFFDDTMPSLEDTEYLGRILSVGGGVYQFKSVIMADMGISETKSTLFEGKERTDEFEDVKNMIAERYAKFGLTRSSTGSFKWDAMVKSSLPKTINITINNGESALSDIF